LSRKVKNSSTNKILIGGKDVANEIVFMERMDWRDIEF